MFHEGFIHDVSNVRFPLPWSGLACLVFTDARWPRISESKEDASLLLHLVSFLTALHHPAPHLQVKHVEATANMMRARWILQKYHTLHVSHVTWMKHLTLGISLKGKSSKHCAECWKLHSCPVMKAKKAGHQRVKGLNLLPLQAYGLAHADTSASLTRSLQDWDVQLWSIS